MPRYSVDMPFAGYFNAIVEADSKDEAIDKVLETTTGTLTLQGDADPEVMEWEILKELSRGNFSFVRLNRAEATELQEDE